MPILRDYIIYWVYLLFGMGKPLSDRDSCEIRLGEIRVGEI